MSMPTVFVLGNVALKKATSAELFPVPFPVVPGNLSGMAPLSQLLTVSQAFADELLLQLYVFASFCAAAGGVSPSTATTGKTRPIRWEWKHRKGRPLRYKSNDRPHERRPCRGVGGGL